MKIVEVYYFLKISFSCFESRPRSGISSSNSSLIAKVTRKMSILVGGSSSTSARKMSIFPTPPETSSQYLKVEPYPSSLEDFKPKSR